MEILTKDSVDLFFDEQPDIIPLHKNSYYQLRGNYSYIWEKHGILYKLTVPSGFAYDGTSVPRILWTISGIYPDGIHRPASLIHDYIYHNKGVLPYGIQFTNSNGEWIPSQGRWDRRDSDRLFCRMLRELNVSKFKRRMMYISVRIFGYFWWAF